MNAKLQATLFPQWALLGGAAGPKGRSPRTDKENFVRTLPEVIGLDDELVIQVVPTVRDGGRFKRALAVMLIGMSACAFAEPKGVELEIREDHAFVRGVVGGYGPVSMLTDSGASSSAIDLDVAEHAGVRLDHRVMINTLLGTRTTTAASSVTVSVGGRVVHGLEVTVMDLAHLRKAFPRAQGVLGYDFLKHDAALIDYSGHRLIFGDAARARGRDLPIVATMREVGGLPVVQASFGSQSRPFDLVVDSGTNILAIRCEHDCPQGRPLGTRIVSTHFGERVVPVVLLSQLRIGNATLPEMIAVLMPPDPLASNDGVLPTSAFGEAYFDGSIARLGFPSRKARMESSARDWEVSLPVPKRVNFWRRMNSADGSFSVVWNRLEVRDGRISRVGFDDSRETVLFQQCRIVLTSERRKELVRVLLADAGRARCYTRPVSEPS